MLLKGFLLVEKVWDFFIFFGWKVMDVCKTYISHVKALDFVYIFERM